MIQFAIKIRDLPSVCVMGLMVIGHTGIGLFLCMNQRQQSVIIDNCAVDCLAEFGVNPVRDFESNEFRLMYTPDLKREYEMALSPSAQTSQQARELIEQILKTGNLIGFFGWDDGRGPCLGFDRGVWIGKDQQDVIASVNAKANASGLPRKRTDGHLVAFARDAIVITANVNESHWKRAPEGAGCVIQWNDLKGVLRNLPNLADAIRHLVSVKHP
jgi:hypothetical protein